jgi:uncharacterized protein with HEPN domain
MNKVDTLELLEYVEQSIVLITTRFKPIENSDDFLKNDNGLEKLDAISMRLQSVGESIKSICKKESSIMDAVADSEYWSSIIRLREIISHHYINIDAEIIFDICQNELQQLLSYIREAKKLCL